MTRVLVVDDDPHIRALVRLHLERDGLEVHEAATGCEALTLLALRSVELIVLDVMMPGQSGLQLCRALRSTSDVPIMMLTARGETADKLQGFSAGVDDYLSKPFDPCELSARVRALLRRSRIALSKEVDVGLLHLDAASHDVTFGDAHLTLPRREFELLFHLAVYPGRTLTREQLIEQLWGYDYAGDERTVDVHIKRLRDRFSEDRHGFRIRTMRGLGYRLELCR